MEKLSILSIFLAGLLIFSSCQEKELGPVANTTDPGAPSIISPSSGESFTMIEDQAEDTLMNIEWTKPDYGFASAPVYTIEMGITGDDFSDPMEIGSVQQTSFPVVVEAFNNRLLSSGFEADQPHSMEIRVTASINDSTTEVRSEPVELSFTPYAVEISYPEIYVPGGYQASSGYTNDWSPADAPPLFSVNDDGNYEGYVYIANDNSEFKFTDERTWDLNWGDDGADGTLEQDGANLIASTAGYYKMNVNLNDMTYEVLNTTWGLIGSATANNWDSDQDMTYDPDAKVWTITTDLTAEEIKFRANDAWDIEYGDTGADGQLDQGGDNIVVPEAGNYTVILDLSEAPYTYSLNKN